MDMEVKQLQEKLINRLVQPLLLIELILTYSIGVGIGRYLGSTPDWVNIILGALLGIFLLLMRNLLIGYFDHPTAPTCRLHSDDARYKEYETVKRQTLLMFALTVMTAGALVTVLLSLRNALSPSAILILSIGFLVCFFSSVPPLQLIKNGYGELIEAILIANIVPALGFLMSESTLPVLLITLTFPLTLLYLALCIIFELETYAFDRTHSNQSLVVRMDWKRSMNGHNLLILAAFLFVGIFSLLGQPWSLTWPMLLPLGLGIFQIIQIQGIMAGSAPKWKLLKWTASGIFVITAYLISLALWTG